MLRSASRIIGYRLSAQDGEVGRCADFLLEPATWTIRHVLVDAGPLRGGQRMLISPRGLRKLEWTSRRWVLEGTRQQLEQEHASEAALASLKRLVGFGLDDLEGNVGHIEDLIVDDDTWQCRHLVVNGEIRLGGRRALVPTEWLGKVLLEEHRVEASVPRARIEEAPEYRAGAPLYHLHAVAAERKPDTRRAETNRNAGPPSSWRRNAPLAWSQALHWGTRKIEAALGRSLAGRQ